MLNVFDAVLFFGFSFFYLRNYDYDDDNNEMDEEQSVKNHLVVWLKFNGRIEIEQ